MLLRSLLVASISSTRVLLLPALSMLSFLSKPDRSFLFNVDRNPVLHAVLRKTFYDQFCGGETGAETRACVRRFKELGFRGVILTYAKETLFDHHTKTQHAHGQGQGGALSSSAIDPDIESWRTGTLETAAQIDEGDFLAIKLTGAGLTVTKEFAAGNVAPPQMMDALHEICSQCKERSIRVIVDAESQHFQKGIDRTALELMRTYNGGEGPAVVYNTYQAYLKGTPNVIAGHLAAANEEKFTVGLKLVRGAYILSDNRALIHDTKQDTDDAYNSIAQGALRQQIGAFGKSSTAAEGALPFPSLNLFLASHNKASVLAANQLHQERVAAGLPTVPVAFGQLHGMSDAVSFSLLQSGTGPVLGLNGEQQAASRPEVFKCTTWGTMGECVAYLTRRAVENRDAVMRTSDEFTALKEECWRRVRAAFSSSSSSSATSPASSPAPAAAAAPATTPAATTTSTLPIAK